MMGDSTTQHFIAKVLDKMPADWLKLTTHRLDIYDESAAKVQFLDHFSALAKADNIEVKTMASLPTAYDYIRLGHPLSCVLEWTVAKEHNLPANNVISFSSHVTPILAILRKNLLDKKKTQIVYTDHLPKTFDSSLIKKVYSYSFEVTQVDDIKNVTEFDGTTIFVSTRRDLAFNELNSNVDFYLNTYDLLGSILIANGMDHYISEIQHVRRRETIAMTPANCLVVLKAYVTNDQISIASSDVQANRTKVFDEINKITHTTIKPSVASSGLSIQYAIMMGLIDHADEHHPGKAIKFIVPPNCYGGTNDQARRVAACIDHIEIVDLLVDSGNDMVDSVDAVLSKVAAQDAVPYIIAEIPTNPRVEVPNLDRLREVLSQARKTTRGALAVDPVFILDQTFCPNVNFLGEHAILSTVRSISYASGSKFPSGGLCTAGYCVGNSKTKDLMDKIETHLTLCDNEATDLQYELLAKQLPSMIKRIDDAYKNTRSFVNFISEKLPTAKINFVSKELAAQGFTPSVFSLDLPTKGDSVEAKEAYKRELNHKLIKMMITQIPNESKYCVSYGQLKGCYWTIPATSTQGTTKEGDKDYIARVALSANMDLEKHKAVFLEFVEGL